MKNTRHVTASELAEMGVCEKRIFLQAKFGRRLSADHIQAQKKGLAAHAEFHRDAINTHAGVRSGGDKPWCFIATAIYGEHAQETRLLREFRDQILRCTDVGRAVIVLYYRLSPRIAAWLRNRPAMVRATRIALLPVLGIASALLKWQKKRICTPEKCHDLG